MAELSKIKFNGAEYDLKDTIARETKENKITTVIGQLSKKSNEFLYGLIVAGSVTDTVIFPETINDLITNSQPLSMDLYFADSTNSSQVFIPWIGTSFTGLASVNGTIAAMAIYYDNSTAQWKISCEVVKSPPEMTKYVSKQDVQNSYDSNSEYPISGLGVADALQNLDISNLTDNNSMIPTTTSQLVNDSDFIASSDIPTVPTNTSELNNDSGFITSADLPNISTFMVKGTDYVTAGQLSGSTLGTKATAEGDGTEASGDYSHAEGNATIASGHASHAEGSSTIASGDYSHAEGNTTIASGDYSHAEGYHITASGDYSHAEGNTTTASGNYSHVEGNHTTAQRRSQHVFGEYNVLDTTGSTDGRGTYVEIVGNGTEENDIVTRSNARTLDWSGNEVLAGKLTVGTAPTANMDVATKQYVDNSIPTVPTNVSAFTNDAGYLTATSTPKTIYVPIEYDETNEKYFTTSEETYNSLRDKINNGWNIVLVYYNNYYYLASDYAELEFKQLFGETLNDFYITWNEQNEILYEETQGTGGTGESWGVYTGNHTSVTEPNTHTFYKDNSNTYIYDGTNFQQISLYELDDIKYHTITRQENTGEYLIDGQEYHTLNNILGSKITILTFSDKIFYYSGDYIFKTLPFIENGTGKMMYYQLELEQGTGINRLSYHITNYESKYQLIPTITNTLASGTLIATINGTNIYAPSYTDADGVSY